MSQVLYPRTKEDPLEIIYVKIPRSVSNILYTEGRRVERHKSQVIRMILVEASQDIKTRLAKDGIKVEDSPRLKSSVAKSKARPKGAATTRKVAR